MSWSNPEPQNPGQFRGDEPNRPDSPMRLLLGTGIVFAVCAFITSFLPGAMALLVLEGMLFWAAMGYVLRAVFSGERFSLTKLNSWDQSLIILAASITVGLFVDPAALEALMAEAGIAQGG